MLARIHSAITECKNCPRLRRYCAGIAEKKKREFKEDTYWGKPVPGFGDPKARLWVMGLAPGAHGANRTGRMFTGDSSGNWLYRALYRAGFANQPGSTHREDGLVLRGAFVSSAGRCAPPDNKPERIELLRCSRFLDEEFKALKNVKGFLALGSIAFEAVLQLLKRSNIGIASPKPRFGHGALYQFEDYFLLASYHPSRQNTNTRKLTEPMFDEIFRRAKKLTCIEKQRANAPEREAGRLTSW